MAEDETQKPEYGTEKPQCSTPAPKPPALPHDIAPGRERAILQSNAKWVNGTVLHYYFFDEDPDPAWAGAEDQRDVVRRSFQDWKDLGIGLEFEEVTDRSEAEVRVGFLQDDGSWSYIGRQILHAGANERTMNFGWSLTDDEYGHTTAMHEIGHTLGLPHEHQNPFAGIVWDEQAVYTYFRGPPNNWDTESTFHNVLRKLTPQEVAGSTWDPDSIMEYQFPGGLIVQPDKFSGGLFPPGTISDVDATWARTWYPGGSPAPKTIKPFESMPLSLQPKGQADFAITPSESREYTIQTFGAADAVMVLFEEVDGQPRYVDGKDDRGTDANATLKLKLFKGRKYVLRVRLQWAGASGNIAVMYW